MSLADLFERVRTGVIHINFLVNGNRVASGTGFVVNSKLVTNNHVFRGPPNSEVFLRFSDSHPDRMNDAFILPYAAFAQRLLSGSDERNFDFAILDIPELMQRVRHQFTFADGSRRRVGIPVAFLGYPLEHLNLVCHAGFISSIYPSGPTTILQVDGSVNASNSGGPLLDVESGEVLGVVTRKATGLSRMFQELLQSFDENMRALQAAQGLMGLNGIDPVAALIASQRQMQHVAREIERSANVGIGYAFSAEHVAGDAVFAHG